MIREFGTICEDFNYLREKIKRWHCFEN